MLRPVYSDTTQLNSTSSWVVSLQTGLKTAQQSFKPHISNTNWFFHGGIMIRKKCIRDDTKAATRQSLNCIKTKINKIWRKRFSIWRVEFLHPAMWHDHDIDFARLHARCNVACGSGIVTVNLPSGSVLQCDTWLWDDMPLNSPKRPPYWNSTLCSKKTCDHIFYDMLK